MGMVGGLDLHRHQITFDVVDVESGVEWRVGAENSSGHAEQAFRATCSDPGDASRPL
jgi:hypothetical protein